MDRTKSPEQVLFEQPTCPDCGAPTAPRTAKRGQARGSKFLGCSAYPNCRWADFDAFKEESVLDRSGLKAAVDRAASEYIKKHQPDATGRWDPKIRKEVLEYVWNRDGRRCGLCAGDMPVLNGAHLEHIVPKVFAVFDYTGDSRVIRGTAWRSRLHDPNNLQAAHSYCNRNKGNTDLTTNWRHPAMPPLIVALTANNIEFIVPKPPDK